MVFFSEWRSFLRSLDTMVFASRRSPTTDCSCFSSKFGAHFSTQFRLGIKTIGSFAIWISIQPTLIYFFVFLQCDFGNLLLDYGKSAIWIRSINIYFLSKIYNTLAIWISIQPTPISFFVPLKSDFGNLLLDCGKSTIWICSINIYFSVEDLQQLVLLQFEFLL